MRDGFVFVDDQVPGIRWDAKYATEDNFTGRPVDGYLVNRVVGSVELCTALQRVQARAAAAGYGLLLWDGYRPRRAVDCFVRWARQPEDGRTKRRHYPGLERSELFELGYVAVTSSHSRGSAVDLTLYDLATGQPVPMGGRHDLMDPISHHAATGIGADERRHRSQLLALMDAGGFASYPSEWWHYSLRDEPYPATYFDFPIG